MTAYRAEHKTTGSGEYVYADSLEEAREELKKLLMGRDFYGLSKTDTSEAEADVTDYEIVAT